jgi:hypothetical protein
VQVGEKAMNEFSDLFGTLRGIMLPYVSQLACTEDTDTNLYINTKHIQKNKKPLFFGAVQIGKNYVSFHLMPVYVNPTLLKPVSPELKKHMQGKSCFNFKSSDTSLFKELGALTEAGFKDFERRGFV